MCATEHHSLGGLTPGKNITDLHFSEAPPVIIFAQNSNSFWESFWRQMWIDNYATMNKEIRHPIAAGRKHQDTIAAKVNKEEAVE